MKQAKRVKPTKAQMEKILWDWRNHGMVPFKLKDGSYIAYCEYIVGKLGVSAIQKQLDTGVLDGNISEKADMWELCEHLRKILPLDKESDFCRNLRKMVGHPKSRILGTGVSQVYADGSASMEFRVQIPKEARELYGKEMSKNKEGTVPFDGNGEGS
jgi:hypothetical protein